jgi:hypothetical protein
MPWRTTIWTICPCANSAIARTLVSGPEGSIGVLGGATPLVRKGPFDPRYRIFDALDVRARVSERVEKRSFATKRPYPAEERSESIVGADALVCGEFVLSREIKVVRSPSEQFLEPVADRLRRLQKWPCVLLNKVPTRGHQLSIAFVPSLARLQFRVEKKQIPLNPRVFPPNHRKRCNGRDKVPASAMNAATIATFVEPDACAAGSAATISACTIRPHSKRSLPAGLYHAPLPETTPSRLLGISK